MSCLTAQEGIWALAALPVWPHGLLEVPGHRYQGSLPNTRKCPSPRENPNRQHLLV